MPLQDLLLEGLRQAVLVAVALSPSTKDQPGDLTHLFHDGAEGSGGTLTVNNLDPKRMPVELEEDEDNKDIKVQGRRPFKPAKKDPSAGPERQLRLFAKRDDAEACVASQFKGFGSVDLWVRLSIDGTVGLVDGTSLGFFELRHDTAGGLLVNRIECVWNAAIDGFTARAVDGGLVVGTPVDFPGARALMLFATQNGTDLELSVALAGFDSYDWTDQTTVHVTNVPSDLDEYCLAFGTKGLAKKGSMFFADLVLSGDLSMSSLSDDEVVLQGQLQFASLCSGNAETWSDPGEFLGNLAVAKEWAAIGVTAWDAARTTFDELRDEGVITGKRAKLMDKAIKKGRKSLKKALKVVTKLVDKGAGAGDFSKAVEKASQRARNHADLATGQLMGLNSSSVDHVYDWAKF